MLREKALKLSETTMEPMLPACACTARHSSYVKVCVHVYLSLEVRNVTRALIIEMARKLATEPNIMQQPLMSCPRTLLVFAEVADPMETLRVLSNKWRIKVPRDKGKHLRRFLNDLGGRLASSVTGLRVDANKQRVRLCLGAAELML